MPEAKIVYVGIHVYLRSDGYENQPSYVRTRNARLADTSLDQVLFLSSSDYQPTIDRFGLNTPYWEKRMFKTNDPNIPISQPRLIESEYPGIHELLTTLYPTDIYRFWGAELRVWDEHPLGACVHSMYNQLDHPGKEIEVNACYGPPIHGPEVEFLRGDFHNYGPWGGDLIDSMSDILNAYATLKSLR